MVQTSAGLFANTCNIACDDSSTCDVKPGYLLGLQDRRWFAWLAKSGGEVA